MLLILQEKATPKDVDALVQKLMWMGFNVHRTVHENKTSLSLVNSSQNEIKAEEFEKLPFVEKVLQFSHPYKLASREYQKKKTVIDINGVKIGSHELAMMVGPCSIESKDQIMECAKIVASQNVKILRGGAFKPRTSPYSFQGLGEEGLRYIREAADKYGLLVITEVMDGDQIELISKYADILQVGARNMQNFSLLKKLGKSDKAIFLKRGLSATYKDLLMSAEYLLERGNQNIMLCERGIRTFESYSRNTFDVAAIPILAKLSHLPIIADPSHGTGIRDIVPAVARASLAAGCDGMMIEMHPTPEKALSDKDQTISPKEFEELMDSLRIIGSAVNIKVS